MLGRTIAVAVLFSCFPTIAHAQIDRYELGRRLREFEVAWEKADVERRKRSVEPLKSAVNSFFTFRLSEAGRSLDRARLAIQSKDAPRELNLWAASIFVKPATRFLDADELPFAVDAFYKVAGKIDGDARTVIELVASDGKGQATTSVPLGKLPVDGKLSIKGIPEGDYRLVWRVFVDKEQLAQGQLTVSLVANGKARLDALQKTVNAWDLSANTIDRATVRASSATLLDLWNKKTLETDYPAAALLSELEQAVKADAANRPFYGRERSGTFWLSVPVGRATYPIRVFAPESAAKNTSVPLVIALHGAGGSENMFFDTYGAGAIVKLCKERGWMLVTTRSGLFGGGAPVGAIVDKLAERYSIDSKQVFLIGHSMGAGQAVDVVGQAPTRFAGVALLGGGGSVKKSEALKSMPFFVAAGSEDFGLRMAKSLNASLRKADVKDVTFREYADIEHLVIVQAALNDVFGFYDGIAKQLKSRP